MPSDRPVTLVVWHDVKKEPPKTPKAVWTAYGVAWSGNGPNGDEVRNGEMDIYGQGKRPMLWCDPVPPSEDALTLDDLRLAAHYADYCADDKLAARLRRAIEAAEKGS